MKPTISKEFIFEYFRGRATSIQKQLINNWIKDPQNEETFYQYLEEWERLHPQYITDVRKGIAGFQQLAENGGRQSDRVAIVQTGRTLSVATLFWVASFTLTLIALGWITRESLLYRHYKTNPGEVTSYLLPDSTRVILNANSSLRVSRLWKFKSERQVILSGEAEFHVAKSEFAKKFTVKTDNKVDIVVLGTVFTVFNRHQRTEVALNEGKVKLMQQTGNSTRTVDMIPGDKVSISADQQLVIESGKDFSKSNLWKKNRFEFDQTSLETVATLLKDHYNLDAIFNNIDASLYTISGSFVAINADEFLESLSLMNGLRFIKTDHIVNFYPIEGEENTN